MRSLRRGEIFRLKGDAVGKPRRVLVVSPQHFNGGIYVTVVPFYSQQLEKRRHHRSCVFFHRGEFGLTDDCVAKTDEVTHLKLSDLRIAEGSVGFVNDDSRMQEISRALCYSLDIQLRGETTSAKNISEVKEPAPRGEGEPPAHE